MLRTLLTARTKLTLQDEGLPLALRDGGRRQISTPAALLSILTNSDQSGRDNSLDVLNRLGLVLSI
jgi:hypothetical protein